MGLCGSKRYTFTATVKGVKVSEGVRDAVANDSCRVFVVQKGGSRVLTATNKKPLVTGDAILFNEEVTFQARPGPLSFVVGGKQSSELKAEVARAEEVASGAMDLVVLAPGDAKGSFERVGVLSLVLTRHDGGAVDERTPLRGA